MVWDLRGALLKKEEQDSSKLAHFEFKHRARTFRLLARALNLDEREVVGLIAHGSDHYVLEELGRRHPDHAVGLASRYEECRTEARRQLIIELGNPAPYRLL